MKLAPVEKRLVEDAVAANEFVEVLFVVDALTATRLVVVARVALKLVIVPEATDRSDIVALVIVVVAKVDVPVTTNVLVVVLFSTVKSVMNAVAAFNRVAKKLVDEAKSKNALVE